MLWLAHFLSIENQELIGYVGIFVLGLMHGANDLALLKKIIPPKNDENNKRELIAYVFWVLIGMGVMYLFPTWGLTLFIVTSGYHFGNQHWPLENESQGPILNGLFQTLYGLLILGILFIFHEKEVTSIILTITQLNLQNIPMQQITISIGLLLVLVGSFLAYYYITFRKQLAKNVGYLVLFTIIFFQSGLIWGFTMYFILWHSLPSIQDQIHFLYQDENRTNWKKYIQSSSLYWGIALIGSVVIYFGISNDTLFKAVFFSLIAAITFPHTLIITWMQNAIHNKSRKSLD
jgi:Brp/Blh family beta-carotene 15,15'-monooxygenase